MSTTNNNTNSTIMNFYELINAGKITEPTPFTYEGVESICYPFDYWEYPMTMDILMRFCNGAKYIEVFGEDIVKMAMSLIKFRDVVKEYNVEENTLPYYLKQCKAYLIKNQRISFKDTVYKGEWSKEVDKKGYKIIYASPYQHWEGAFLKNCLMLKFPYLTEFKLECYHLNSNRESYNGYDDFYISIPKPEDSEKSISLYCPISAFIEQDFSIIEKRMTEYFGWYYTNNPERKEEILAVLNFPETIKLHKMMEQFKADNTLFRDTKSYNQFISKFTIKRKCYQPKYGEMFVVSEVCNGNINKPATFLKFENAYQHLMKIVRTAIEKTYPDAVEKADTLITVNFEEGTARGTYEHFNTKYSWAIDMVKTR